MRRKCNLLNLSTLTCESEIIFIHFSRRTANISLNLPIKVPAAEETPKPKTVSEPQPMTSSSILCSLRAEQRASVVSTAATSGTALKSEDVDMEDGTTDKREIVEPIVAEVPQKDDMSVDEDDEDEGEAQVVRAGWGIFSHFEYNLHFHWAYSWAKGMPSYSLSNPPKCRA